MEIKVTLSSRLSMYMFINQLTVPQRREVKYPQACKAFEFESRNKILILNRLLIV